MKKQSQRTAGAGKKRSLLQQLEDCYDEGYRNEKRRRKRLEEEESEDLSSQDSIIEKPRTKSKENVGQGKRIEPRSNDDDEKGNDGKYFGSRKSEKIIIIDESEKQEQSGTPALRPDIAEKKCKDRAEKKLKGSTGSKNVIEDGDFEVEEKRNQFVRKMSNWRNENKRSKTLSESRRLDTRIQRVFKKDGRRIKRP